MAYGDIGSILDNIQFDAVGFTARPEIVRLSDTVIAIIYFSLDVNSGIVKTYPIAPDGTISGAMIDSGIFDALGGSYSRSINTSGDIYAIVFVGTPGSTCKVATISITAAGAVGPVIDSLVIRDGSGAGDPYVCLWPNIIQGNGNVYVVPYYTAGAAVNWGFLDTINIDGVGAITAIDSYNLGVDSFYPSIVRVPDTTTYALVRTDAGVPGKIETITIADNGAIGPILDNVSLNSAVSLPQIVRIPNYGSNAYLVSYAFPDDGWFETYLITDAGIITLVDIHEWHTTKAVSSEVIAIMQDDGNNTIVLIAYISDSNRPWVTTYSISSAGAINSPAIDNLRLSVGIAGGFLGSAHISGDLYAVGVSVLGAQLYIVDIETRDPPWDPPPVPPVPPATTTIPQVITLPATVY